MTTTRIAELQDFIEVETKKVSERHRGIRKAQEEIEILRDLPARKRKYEGKYFTYSNSYGGSTVAERWPIFSCVREAKTGGEFIADSFESRPDGAIEIKISARHSEFMFQREITKWEYKRALTKLMKTLSGLQMGTPKQSESRKRGRA